MHLNQIKSINALYTGLSSQLFSKKAQLIAHIAI
jgi:hypothetical protein